MTTNTGLQEVDEVRVTILMDNTIDVLMANTEVARRMQLWNSQEERPTPRAEHGFSAWVEVRRGEQTNTALLDTGVTTDGVLNNMAALGLDPARIQAVVLSHGHNDHAAGLPNLLDRLGPGPVPLVLHPHATLDRKLMFQEGKDFPLRTIQPTELRRANVEWIETTAPTRLFNGLLLVSGQVERQTPFEQGFFGHYAKREGGWEPDPLILDDQCLIVHVRGKGLVVITGCGHAGVINTLRHAQKITGVETIYALIGGFHLTGGNFEQAIPPTIQALQAIHPRYIVPCHCTGWSAVHQIAQALPNAFIPNSVGTTYILKAGE